MARMKVTFQEVKNLQRCLPRNLTEIPGNIINGNNIQQRLLDNCSWGESPLKNVLAGINIAATPTKERAANDCKNAKNAKEVICVDTVSRGTVFSDVHGDSCTSNRFAIKEKDCNDNSFSALSKNQTIKRKSNEHIPDGSSKISKYSANNVSLSSQSTSTNKKLMENNPIDQNASFQSKSVSPVSCISIPETVYSQNIVPATGFSSKNLCQVNALKANIKQISEDNRDRQTMNSAVDADGFRIPAASNQSIVGSTENQVVIIKGGNTGI